MFSETFFQTIVSAIITLLIAATIYTKWTYSYWKRKKFPYLESCGVFGTLGSSAKPKEHLAILIKTKIYNTIKQNKWKHGGFYLNFIPFYIVTDLEYLKNVMTKDFQHFVDRGVYYNEKADPLRAHLLTLNGQKWKNLRSKLNPAFTSMRVKTMFSVLLNCAEELLIKVESNCVQKRAIDIKEALACFSTNVIGSCAFGLDLDALADDSPFLKYAKMIFTSTPIKQFKKIFANIFPNVSTKLGVSLTPKDVSDFFLKLIRDTVNHREANNYHRKDFLQILIDLKNEVVESGEIRQTLTMEQVAAQCFVFFFAGFETTAITMTFALYQMAKNQDVQDKVRKEIVRVLEKHSNQLTYEAIQEMKYMNQVIDETLRMYPPIPMVTRQCVKDYKIPDTNLVIEKGTRVIIPILAIHHDEEFYPNPENFDPERFTEENKKLRHGYAHIPFGEGPRICIGMKFGLMQTKVGLAALLKKYNFTVDPKTQEPLEMNPRSAFLTAKGEIWLSVQAI